MVVEEIVQTWAAEKLLSAAGEAFGSVKYFQQHLLGCYGCFVQIDLPIHQSSCDKKFLNRVDTFGLNNQVTILSYVHHFEQSRTGHTPFGDIFVSQSPDMEFWGKHRHMMGPSKFEDSGWQCTKIGAGPVPIETDEGWLLIYHGVITTCQGYVYRMGAALLDRDEPWKVLYRTSDYIMAPYEDYEMNGDVPNVTFPCATLCDAETGRIAIYYGAADTVTGLAFTTVDELLTYMRKYPNPHFGK